MTFFTISVSPSVISSGNDFIAGEAWISSYVAGRSACRILNLNEKMSIVCFFGCLWLKIFRSNLFTYNQTISCCNSDDKFVGGSGNQVIIALIIPNAFIFANGCWPVAISNYTNQINITSKDQNSSSLYCWKTQCPHIWSDSIPFRCLWSINTFRL